MELLKQFERELDPQQPEQGPGRPRIIGYGEISTVFTFEDRALSGRAYKRMAIFEDQSESEYYLKGYFEYNALLEKAGVHVPDHDGFELTDHQGRPVLYLSQSLLNPDALAHRAIHDLVPSEAVRMFEVIIGRVHDLFSANAANPGVQLGLDAQLSNWVLSHAPRDGRLPRRIGLSYIDTSLPLIRRDGQEEVNAELFLRVCPVALSWILRRFFLDEVLDRYYLVREVLLDLIANLIKERAEHLIEPYLAVANRYLERWPEAKPIETGHVRAYYREDALIWRLFLSFRKMERFWRLKIRRQPYSLILPGPISR